jgi:hypothetical protein
MSRLDKLLCAVILAVLAGMLLSERTAEPGAKQTQSYRIPSK